MTNPDKDGKIRLALELSHYDADNMDWYICPNCLRPMVREDFVHCPDCGIKINWLEEVFYE